MTSECAGTGTPSGKLSGTVDWSGSAGGGVGAGLASTTGASISPVLWSGRLGSLRGVTMAPKPPEESLAGGSGVSSRQVHELKGSSAIAIAVRTNDRRIITLRILLDVQ